MKFLNLGVLAHVDAGKTSLTERLLFDAGVIDHLGSVDGGDTQTDSLAIERRRGITIQSAVVALPLDDLQVNLIDTPGHSDFVAEVERALRVLDGAILVISAVEGVQARTRLLMRALRRMNVPTIVFVNKIDRVGARYQEMIDSIRHSLALNVLPMSDVTDIGTPQVLSRRREGTDPEWDDALAAALSENGERFLHAFVHGTPPENISRAELIRQTQECLIHPLIFGSAMTGAGVRDLVDTMSVVFRRSTHNSDDLLRATVFKIERGDNGEKVAYVRMRSGIIRKRDRVAIWRHDRDGRVSRSSSRVSAVRVFERGTALRDTSATAGSIAKLWGLSSVRIGDHLGIEDDFVTEPVFAPPTLETVVKPVDPNRRHELFTALGHLSEEDPLIQVRRDPDSGALSMNLYGEVQKEVIGARLAESYRLDVEFEESWTIYVERPIGTGSAFQKYDPKGPNFFWATIGLRVEPAAEGSGFTYEIGKLRGMLPLAFHASLEDGVRSTLAQGPHGWSVVDCTVTLTHARFQPPVSTAAHFRNLAALLTAEALESAGTVVCEPIHRFELEAPTEALTNVLNLLLGSRGSVDEQVAATDTCRLVGIIPADNVHSVARQIPGLTRGAGSFISDFHGYRPVAGIAPSRTHVGANPYDRDEYMLHVLRKM